MVHIKKIFKKKKNERSDGKYSRICRTMESVTTIQLCSYNAKAAIDDTKNQPGCTATEHFSMDTEMQIS